MASPTIEVPVPYNVDCLTRRHRVPFCESLDALEKYKEMGKRYGKENGLLELIYHLAVVLDHSESGFIRLFEALTSNPQNLQGCYFPAMPSDIFEDVASVVGVLAYSLFTLRHCAVILDLYQGLCSMLRCGQPMEILPCPECQQPLGGQAHDFLAGHGHIQNRDNTKPGHCLGDVKDRPLEPIAERDLPRISVILQQMLIHLSMLLGALYGNEQAICDLIEPQVTTNVVEFLTDHLKHDLFLMGKVFDKNEDDTKLLIHLLLKILMKDTSSNNYLAVDNLTSNDGRENYEKSFNNHIIRNFVSNLEVEFENSLKKLAIDHRTMENPLMRHLYEIEFPYDSTIDNVDPTRCYQLWSYRQPVTVENFKLEIQKLKYMFETDGNDNASISLLTSVMEKENILTKISELSKLLELQSILMHHFNFRIDKKTALSMTIGDAIKELSQDVKRLKRLVDKIPRLWKFLKPWLEKYGRFQLNKDHLEQSMDMKTPLAYFLCKPGTCMMAMFEFLAYHQNEFLSQYKKMPGAVVKEIALQKISKTDLITYSTEEDLLPVIYTHCHYSLELGKGTKIAYNMEKIVQHLVDKIYYGKSLISIVIKQFVYQDDMHNVRKFNNLGKSIPQINIGFADQHNMMMELKEISEVSHALNAVEISIGFLTATITPVDSEQPYLKYLTDVLKMDGDKFIPSRKMQCTLRLKHLYSAWLMLTIEKAIRLEAQNQNPFECEDRYCCTLDEENDVAKYLSHVDLFQLITVLTEYLVCGDINSLPEKSEEEFTLQASLEIYEDQNEKSLKLTKDLHIPSVVLLKHLYHFWKAVVHVYQKKKEDS